MILRFDYAAAAPQGFRALGGVYRYVQQCGLPASLVELVFLRVSQINGCAYCIDMHTTALRRSGMDERKLALVPVWREVSTFFDTQEAAALDWAETVTKIAEAHVPDVVYDYVSRAFSEKELADLTIAVGLMNAFNRLAIGFRRMPDIKTDAG